MNKARLEKLATHLETGDLGHPVFDFSVFNANPFTEKPPGPTCGTAGCALGEMPILFPRSWKFDRWGDPVLRGRSINSLSFEHAMEFFDLGEAQVRHLFSTRSQQPDKFGGEFLDRHATRYQVAANIRAFVAKMG